MNSLLLTTLARGLVYVMLIFSIYLLYRGHNAPGGGFIGGLVAAVGFALAAKGFGQSAAIKMLRFDPRTVIATGLCAAVSSGLLSAFKGQPFFTSQSWLLGGEGGFPLTTVLLFDIGVYLVVLGATMLFFFCLERPEIDAPTDEGEN